MSIMTKPSVKNKTENSSINKTQNDDVVGCFEQPALGHLPLFIPVTNFYYVNSYNNITFNL